MWARTAAQVTRTRVCHQQHKTGSAGLFDEPYPVAASLLHEQAQYGWLTIKSRCAERWILAGVQQITGVRWYDSIAIILAAVGSMQADEPLAGVTKQLCESQGTNSMWQAAVAVIFSWPLTHIVFASYGNVIGMRVCGLLREAGMLWGYCKVLPLAHEFMCKQLLRQELLFIIRMIWIQASR